MLVKVFGIYPYTEQDSRIIFDKKLIYAEINDN